MRVTDRHLTQIPQGAVEKLQPSVRRTPIYQTLSGKLHSNFQKKPILVRAWLIWKLK